MLPRDGADTPEVFNDVQLRFAREVIADVIVGKFGGARFFFLFLDKDDHADAGYDVEDVLPLTFACVSVFAANETSQVEAVNSRKFLHEAPAEAGHRFVVDIGAVGDEGNNAGVSDAVGGPAEGADVGVVEAIFQSSVTCSGVSFGDASVKAGILFVLVVVVGGFLTGGVGRVAKDDADRLAAEALEALAVVFEAGEEVLVFRAGFVHAEGIREADAFEGLVLGGLHAALVGDFDVHAGDVVGQQHDLAGEELGAEFAR